MWEWLLSLFRKSDYIPDNSINLSEQINDYRVGHRKTVLIVDLEITKIAFDWATLMNKRNQLTHGDYTEHLQKVYPVVVKASGENVAYGQDPVLIWLRSIRHNRNMLGNWTHVGSAQSGFYSCAIFVRM